MHFLSIPLVVVAGHATINGHLLDISDRCWCLWCCRSALRWIKTTMGHVQWSKRCFHVYVAEPWLWLDLQVQDHNSCPISQKVTQIFSKKLRWIFRKHHVGWLRKASPRSEEEMRSSCLNLIGASWHCNRNMKHPTELRGFGFRLWCYVEHFLNIEKKSRSSDCGARTAYWTQQSWWLSVAKDENTCHDCIACQTEDILAHGRT